MTATPPTKRAAEDGFEFSVATAPSTARHFQLALVVVIATLIAYAVVVPYTATPLPRTDSFIPTVIALIFVADLVTAVLIYAQFYATGLRPLLVLASGYLFSSLIVVGHVLTFPGAFAPEGLIGAGPQSSLWLNFAWRVGLAALMALYAVLRSRARAGNAIEARPRSAIAWSVAVIVAVVCVLILAATAGHDFLPPLVSNGMILPLGKLVIGAVALASLIALTVLIALTRGRSILDLWLIVAATALLAEGTMGAFFVSERFTLGFYATRLISLPASKVVLVVLLWETMTLYAALSISNRELRRERASRLTNAASAVAAIAHEIRQPLAGINLTAYAGRQLLDRSAPDVGKAKNLFDEIKTAAVRANEVFDSFLRLFREGRRDLQAVDVNALTLDAVQQLRPNFDNHGVAIRTQLASNLPRVEGHAGQLRVVVLNLLQNAIDALATAEGSRLITITTARHAGGAISLSVEDTGPGIEPGKLASIFDPFVTTKTNGTGLGLAICNMIIDQHGGSLSAASGENGGARFEISLPAGAPARPDSQNPLNSTTSLKGARSA